MRCIVAEVAIDASGVLAHAAVATARTRAIRSFASG
jgi:hypothetical protein